MGRITSIQYASMASRVYNLKAGAEAKEYNVENFKTQLFQEGMNWGATNTDFKGCVYVSRELQEAVVAFQGTVPQKGGDLLADLQIGIGSLVGMLPQYTSAALRLFRRTAEAYPGYSISLVGHSLGGGMAQVIGHWTGAPFVTFNAPGMWNGIQTAKVVFLWSPRDTLNSIAGTFRNSAFSKQAAATGRNFRNVFDPVSNWGSHYGPVTRFWGKGMHSMDDLELRIRSSKWKNVNPFDLACKEWGEL
jgi:hypothetical protein